METSRRNFLKGAIAATAGAAVVPITSKPATPAGVPGLFGAEGPGVEYVFARTAPREHPPHPDADPSAWSDEWTPPTAKAGVVWRAERDLIPWPNMPGFYLKPGWKRPVVIAYREVINIVPDPTPVIPPPMVQNPIV